MQKDRVIEILGLIEDDLRQRGLWGGVDKRPSESAFMSTTPFFLDTMEFHQWLEYVLIEKLKFMLDKGHDIPKMTIAPMAQEYYRGQWQEYKSLITLLRELDAIF